MGPLEYIAIGVAALFVIAIIVAIIAGKKNKKRRESNVVETKDARFTYETQTTDAEGDAKMTYVRQDIMIAMGKTFKVAAREKGAIKPGKYIVLCTDDNTPKFNMRVGDYVKEYKHNQEIILAEGTEITAISASVILR